MKTDETSEAVIFVLLQTIGFTVNTTLYTTLDFVRYLLVGDVGADDLLDIPRARVKKRLLIRICCPRLGDSLQGNIRGKGVGLKEQAILSKASKEVGFIPILR